MYAPVGFAYCFYIVVRTSDGQVLPGTETAVAGGNRCGPESYQDMKTVQGKNVLLE